MDPCMIRTQSELSIYVLSYLFMLTPDLDNTLSDVRWRRIKRQVLDHLGDDVFDGDGGHQLPEEAHDSEHPQDGLTPDPWDRILQQHL